VIQSLAIVHEDPHCLVIAKPPGQFTQGLWAPDGEITLETAVRQYLNPGAPGSAYLGIVHRLDRPTSGLLIWAKTPKAAHRLSSQFERRRVVKEYWAIVESGAASRGPPQAREETWTDWLTRADAVGVVHTVLPGTPGAREAVTVVSFEQAILSAPGLAWLRLWPRTGRTHQLRVQAARRGWPIVGDTAYGSTVPSPLAPGIALHARALSLNHPITGAVMAFVAPLPATWAPGWLVVPEPAASEALERGASRPLN
jgi:23S rRNA pseudouridine1911/1915/1917 synthase